MDLALPASWAAAMELYPGRWEKEVSGKHIISEIPSAHVSENPSNDPAVTISR